MIKMFVRAAATLFVLALVASCSQKGFNTNLTIEPKPVPGVDWTQYKSWSFGRQGEYVQTGIAELDDPAFRKSVAENTTKLMTGLGYEHVNETPDMLLMFHVVVEQRYDEVKMNPAYQDFDLQWAQASSEDTWQEGSLFLFAIDAKTGKQIWSSSAKAELDKHSTFDTKKTRFNEVVTRMLADFPKHSS
jgi:uncharacterized protein DUF4136